MAEPDKYTKKWLEIRLKEQEKKRKKTAGRTTLEIITGQEAKPADMKKTTMRGAVRG